MHVVMTSDKFKVHYCVLMPSRKSDVSSSTVVRTVQYSRQEYI
jgi:hypothetical protein